MYRRIPDPPHPRPPAPQATPTHGHPSRIPGHPQGVALLYTSPLPHIAVRRTDRPTGLAPVYSRATPCGWPGAVAGTVPGAVAGTVPGTVAGTGSRIAGWYLSILLLLLLFILLSFLSLLLLPFLLLSLLFLLLLQFQRVVAYILASVFQFLGVADDTFKVIWLPDDAGIFHTFSPGGFEVAQPCYCCQGLVCTHDSAQRCGLLHIAFYMDNKMDMIGHNHKFIQGNTRKPSGQSFPCLS